MVSPAVSLRGSVAIRRSHRRALIHSSRPRRYHGHSIINPRVRAHTWMYHPRACAKFVFSVTPSTNPETWFLRNESGVTNMLLEYFGNLCLNLSSCSTAPRKTGALIMRLNPQSGSMVELQRLKFRIHHVGAQWKFFSSFELTWFSLRI